MTSEERLYAGIAHSLQELLKNHEVKISLDEHKQYVVKVDDRTCKHVDACLWNALIGARNCEKFRPST